MIAWIAPDKAVPEAAPTYWTHTQHKPSQPGPLPPLWLVETEGHLVMSHAQTLGSQARTYLRIL